MKICYFGIYNPEYCRNKILLKGLRENGVEVIECCARINGWRKYLDLYRKHRLISHSYDLMIVGFPGQGCAIFAWFLTRKPIVLDAYLSLYNAIIIDRKKFSARSGRAAYFWIMDWLSCRLATLVLLDTNEHIRYFVETFSLPQERFIRVLIGANDEVFVPQQESVLHHSKVFEVMFHGTFIPVQGIEFIVYAAEQLKSEKDIAFTLIGSGQEYERIQALAAKLQLTNVRFTGKVTYDELVPLLQTSDVMLGNFGTGEKTTRVIANKTYETLALGKAHITADVPAIREVCADGVNILLCRPGDPRDLAEKILFLKQHPDVRETIARGGRALFLSVATPRIIAKQLIESITRMIKAS